MALRNRPIEGGHIKPVILADVDAGITTRLPVANYDYADAVALGLVPGVKNVPITGEIPDVDIGSSPKDIWDQGGIMTYSTSADIDTISSSDDGDNQVVMITGQTYDGVEVVQTATLNGQSKVTLSTPLWRVYNKIRNRSNTDFAGDIYIYVDTDITDGVPDDDTKIRAKINIGKNGTLMSHYTIPANNQGVYLAGLGCLNGAVQAIVQLETFTRLDGEVFVSSGSLTLDSSGVGCFNIPIEAREPIPARTDIVVRVMSSTANNVSITINNQFRLYSL